MVEITEETNAGSDANRDGPSASTSAQQRVGVADFIKDNGMDTIIFTLRMLTIFFGIQYLLPSGSAEYSKSVYTKAFVASGFSNAFRLYQRAAPNGFPNINREFLVSLMLEDSVHYILYSMIFSTNTPVTMALIPIVAFAWYNSVAYIQRFSQATGNGISVAQKLNEFRVQQSANILSLVACAEIFNFPIFFALIFTGRCNIFFPVLYFRFLTFRYASRRNPYSRIVFASLKQSLVQVTSSPSCPQVIRSAILNSINLVERFAPPT
ncbi:hypothetical protein FO519_002207 [Halicephalobus sp. NKZ332]|nr:hypothetical protein FO519_002207 [Halicephalobus sp. NKZ332]